MDMIEYCFLEKPVLQNKYRTLHFRVWGPINKRWRETFYILALEKKTKFFTPVNITVVHEVAKGIIPDCGACAPCVKAAIDGLVDGKVIPDDTPEWLHSITFLAPKKTGRDALTLVIEKAGQ